MAIVTPTNKEVLDFEGLHLYHAFYSNCSMRVRMTLEEKGLPWVSHHLDLMKGEHITPEYFGINPNGLVPTLVHDGVVIIESNDIIDYIDNTFPEPPLKPTGKQELAEMNEWLRLATSIHLNGVKTYMYAKKFGGKMRKSAEEQSRYRELQTNEELLAYHAKVSSEEGITGADVEVAAKILRECFTKVEQALSEHQWLVGDTFSLADISWIPLHSSLSDANYPFEEYPKITAWNKAIHSRAGFQKGVLEWMKAS